MKNFILDVEKNAEGSVLAYLSEEGAGVGYRIAGPKAWGGSRKIASLQIRGRDFVTFISEFAPEVVEAIVSQHGQSPSQEADDSQNGGGDAAN